MFLHIEWIACDSSTLLLLHLLNSTTDRSGHSTSLARADHSFQYGLDSDYRPDASSQVVKHYEQKTESERWITWSIPPRRIQHRVTRVHEWA